MENRGIQVLDPNAELVPIRHHNPVKERQPHAALPYTLARTSLTSIVHQFLHGLIDRPVK